MTATKLFACDLCVRRYKTDGALQDHRRDSHGIDKPATLAIAYDDPRCIECREVARLVGGNVIYPHREDLFHKSFWLCDCGAYCGCHGITTRPLGFPAGAETRRARNNAHAVFDPLWRSGGMDRRAAYGWLAERMGLPSEQCHIGMMTAAQAREVIAHCRDRRFGAAA